MAYRTPPAGHADIGRSTIFGNPVRIGFTCPVCHLIHRDAGSTLPCFEKHARQRILVNRDELYITSLASLAGKPLWCPGCGVNSPTCHGRIIEKLISELLTITPKS